MSEYRNHTAEEKYLWLSNQGVKLKTYLAQFWTPGLFNSAIEDFIWQEKNDHDKFWKKWNS